MACEQSIYHVAIIGGGITGSMAAKSLVDASDKVHVTLLDQGRSVGGRSSHRRIDAASKCQLTPEQQPGSHGIHNFDHGCQFFRADDGAFRAVVQEWVTNGWAAKWDARFGILAGDGQGDTTTPTDFFGLNKSTEPVYVGVEGISSVVRGLLAAAVETGRCEVMPGVRVASMEKSSEGKWLLVGPAQGSAGSFHDTPESAAMAEEHNFLVSGRKFDAVLVTDVSASFEAWHRASAGVPEVLSSQVRDRVRVPLFTSLVVFAPPGVPPSVALDAATVHGDSCLWFAGRSPSKPGLSGSEHTSQGEAWTLVSTPAYATAEIERVPMRDPTTGAFRPQDPSYLVEGPSALLLRAFESACRRRHQETSPDAPFAWPEVAYVGGQRWGSALPAPVNVGGRDAKGQSAQTTKRVCGTAYESAGSPPVFEASKVGGELPPAVCVAEEERMVYAGDFCSQRNPGFEAAALSGKEAAEKILAWAAAAVGK